MRYSNTDTTFKDIYKDAIDICNENNIKYHSQDTCQKSIKKIPKYFEKYIMTKQISL